MGFLDDLRKGAKKAREIQEQVKQAAEQEVELTAEAEVVIPDRTPQFDWALPEEYDPIPPLRLRRWGEFDGREPGRGGFGFEFPDGRWLHPDRLGVRRWKGVGVFVGNLAGGKFHLDDLNDPSFSPGQPLRLVAEPDNPHSKHGRAISIRNWADDKVAGYVPTDYTKNVRKMTEGEDFGVIALSGRFASEGGRVIRTFLDWAMFRPGRIEGLDEALICPPIAPPREPY